MAGRMRNRLWTVLATKRGKLWPTRIRWTKDEIYPLTLITLAAPCDASDGVARFQHRRLIKKFSFERALTDICAHE